MPGRTTIEASSWSGWVALAWATAFAYLGLASVPPLPDVGVDRVDLLGHAVASFLLAALLAVWLREKRGIGVSSGSRAAALGAFAFGLMIETLQTARPSRGFELLDIAADLVGSVAGPWAYSRALAAGVRAVPATVVWAGMAAIVAVAVLAVFTF